ncbi:MAG TPA: hypothetical protein VF734_16680 [Pseudonocardiaceae bacterium]
MNSDAPILGIGLLTRHTLARRAGQAQGLRSFSRRVLRLYAQA